MRLIDADGLKDFTYINKGNFNTVDGIREWVDNAPTVKERIEYGTDGKPYILYISNGSEYARPTGEWIPVSTRDMTEEEVKE